VNLASDELDVGARLGDKQHVSLRVCCAPDELE